MLHRPPRIFATIDIGSNGVRLFVARRLAQGLRVLEDGRVPLRLGEDSFRVGKITDRTIDRLAACFLEFRQRALKLGALHIRAAATSALRDAKNSDHVINEIWRRTGIRIELIDGVEEACLLHLAIRRSLSLGRHKALLLDMGGGSLETVIAQGPRIEHALSLRLGTVRLLERCGADAPYRDYAQIVRRELDRLVMTCDPFSDLILPRVLVGTGGCLRALTRITARLHHHRTRPRLSLGQVEELTDLLFSLSLGQRMQRLGLKKNRADVIRPAVAILNEIMRSFNFEQILIPNVGIKNGLFWQLSDRVLEPRLHADL